MRLQIRYHIAANNSMPTEGEGGIPSKRVLDQLFLISGSVNMASGCLGAA